MTAWASYQPPLRACDLCDHGRDVGGMRYCVCTEVVMPSRALPVAHARSNAGACGAEARFMSAPFLATR
jgi:hypothetical protein